MIGVIDYGAGNLGSVMNALKRMGCEAEFVRGPEELSGGSGAKAPYEKVLFPGDGHFATAMASLKKSGYAAALQEWIQADKPFLGICIGLQLLFDSSEEAPPVDGKPVRGLGVIPGTVKRFPGRKVPQIGWNQTQARPASKLFRGLPENSFFYYIHSYYVDPVDESAAAAWAEYYLRYCSVVERGALAAVQFHPEKSGALGLQVLENWAR
ncbi:imidazole glycerol phosphate synthase, glutamine amidotransferase subunit [Treponema primitia ZAS-2]|uniref:Imidazole glycerol phosphate synthase subunit HisH n=1 Tax=Treponema primitia (strain ATCC BAA-887 / DSM 12427 / ZAS-2) TaxID=545694 RepID=F5YL05_TREPZ|nr:imidazole glycerol phosphate synthase subunit HisH [Treponema primitia]AEF86426.1 imidazole glycerol phosphate synthase, glutamine amidotransferase subunit [Treponema primitia ZAS-2]